MVCYFLMLSIGMLLLNGCAVTRDVLEILPRSGQEPDSIEKNYFIVEEDDDVVGRLATIRIEKGDTLPDIARHFSLGINTVSAANPGVDVWVPKAGERIVLPLSFILPEANRKGIVINLAAMRLFHFKRDGKVQAVATYPVGVGTTERPTPKGRMYIARKKFRPTWFVPASIAADHRKKGDPLAAMVPPGPLNPLGEHALYLSRSEYLIHGTNKPASIGLRATNGCIRLYPEDIKQLFEITPVKTPVSVVYQPYLVGWRDGRVYLEAHTPFEEFGTAELEKAYAKLKKIEKKTGDRLDWHKIKTVVAEARGIPVAISAIGAEGEPAARKTIKLRHPVRLYGQPPVPELRTDAWYVLAAIMGDPVEALRLATILNHQGPPISSQVLSKDGRYRVLAGPFKTNGEAKNASRRMRIDLEIDGIVVAPVQHK
ncbi:transpeptidase [Desulfosarcina ovata subsp. ovata]|uniref:Transpeptidase n=2 Tax=Desulfosarcina ovata TaxID=83564 RepID=A0A5K8AH65_9BACT|nr:transpeptidase [Desulfosarcina ovata subsp. ovata]